MPDEDPSRVLVRSEEVNRIELLLGPGRQEGYLRTGRALMPLPIGSHLDSASGAFTWAPGPGFVGTYDLVFVRHAAGRAVARREVRIVLAPKRSGSTSPQLVIEAPRAQQDAAQPFLVGGWAADLGAPSGTGVASLHVWAYPLTGGPPLFLGTATYGGMRPDVAALYGDQFGESSYGLVVQGLPHGHYDLAVFAWSAEKADFVVARSLRITVR